MPIFQAADIRDDLDLSADAVVVGSGAGGAVIAHELARLGHDVILLEQGAYHPTSSFRSDPQWSFENLYAQRGVTTALGLPPVLIPHGECVGGTTVINSGTVFRVPGRILSRWQAEHGAEGISSSALAPFYDVIEERIGATPAAWPALGELNRVIERGVQKLGLRGGPLVRNAPHCVGCGACVFGCPSGAKQSMLVTFIPAADQLGVRLYSEAVVDRVLTAGSEATGVAGRIVERASGTERARFTVRARVVVLAAGAFGTPLLLEDNDLCGTSGARGRHLHIHPAGGALARMPETVAGWRAIPQGYMVEDWADEGILLEGGFGPPGVVGLMVPGFGGAYQERMRDYDRLAAFGLMVEDRDSVGSVTRLAGRPLIRYALGRDDTRRLVFGWKQVLRILFAAGAVEAYPAIQGFDVLHGPGEIDRIDEHAVAGRDLTLSAYHPMGTCRIGANPRTGVVDANLEAWDVRRLFVADASIFPTALGVNPQATIMAFAARAADYLHRNRDRYFPA